MSDAPKKIALVIGVNGGPETGLAPLRFAEDSAQQVARMLTAPASDFMLHEGAPLLGPAVTTDVLRRTIFDARRAAGPDGLLVIYYIGHGRYVEIRRDISDVYLVTHNFRPGDVRDDPEAHLSMRWLQEKVLRHREPRQLLLVLDCCFAGAVGEAAPDPELVNLQQRLDQALGVQGTMDGVRDAPMRKVLTAVSPLLKAYEADGTTCYTGALLRGLAGAAALENGRVTWQGLHAYLQEQFADAQTGEYGFDRSAGAVLAYHPNRARLRTPDHQPWVMPYPPSGNFVGREEELDRLAVTLTGEAATSAALLPAVAGIGGIGKTRLAIEFAHRYRAHFPGGVFWLSMENASTIEAQVAACGGQRGLQLFDHEPGDQLSYGSTSFDGVKGTFEAPRLLNLREQAQQVMALWEGPEHRLLIFDNLEDPALLDRWRPRGGGCRVLITTRRQTWSSGSGVRPFPLGNLLDDASRALLLGPRAVDRGCSIASLLADPDEAEAARGLVTELDGLPLALTLAGGYLAKSSIPLVGYLALLRQESVNHGSLSAELAEGLPAGSRASVAAAFALSYERLGESAVDRLARIMWLAAAQFAPEPIDAEVLLRTADLDPSSTQQREQGESALRCLRELGLIEETDETYRLHRLLGAYARTVVVDQSDHQRRAAQGLAQTIIYLDDKGDLWSNAIRFRGHIQQLIRAALKAVDAEVANFWYASGLVMYEEEDYATARCYYHEALVIQEAVLGRCHHKTVRTLRALGCVAREEKDYSTARHYLQETLAIQDAMLGRRHCETAGTLCDLGNLAYHEGDYGTARRYCQEALEIQEAVLGRNHRDTARTLYGLGSIAYYNEQYTIAWRYYHEALMIQEAVRGAGHRTTAYTLHALGLVAYHKEDYATARRYFQEALAIRKSVFDRRYHETAGMLHNLGEVAYREEDYATARRYFQEALAIQKSISGRTHEVTTLIIFSQRTLLMSTVFTSSFCALSAWFLLPRPLDLLAAGVLLSLGAIGYRWWGPAMMLLHILWRVQFSAVLVFLLLAQLQRFSGMMTLLTHYVAIGPRSAADILFPAQLQRFSEMMTLLNLYVAIAAGGAFGILWSWLRVQPHVRATRVLVRRLLRQRTLRYAARKGKARA